MSTARRQVRAARRAKVQRREYDTTAAEPTFSVDGLISSRAEFIEANTDDPDVVSWANRAKVGETYPAFVPCERLS